ncbi:hypothetical protein LTR12_003994 [Friedmanniomyces endolithicus]|nr:hypothetical protein LTR74_007862 [Friedmanniomyces endolithicus]KAK1821600.1 hypothetical protein LTR12_003994 [Friedmanniomyces endolithicus]
MLEYAFDSTRDFSLSAWDTAMKDVDVDVDSGRADRLRDAILATYDSTEALMFKRIGVLDYDLATTTEEFTDLSCEDPTNADYEDVISEEDEEEYESVEEDEEESENSVSEEDSKGD